MTGDERVMRVMRLVCAAAAAVLVAIGPAPAGAQQPFPPPPGTPQQQVPPTQPPTPGQTTPGQPGAPVAPAAPAPAPQPRTFSAPVGLLLNTVRADRVDDFEKAMGYLQAALAASTDERVRAQAAGWRIFKATEPAPAGAVLYVFVVDPTVMGADYSLGRIFAEAYPDQAKLQEVWKLYSGSVTGASLINLSPLKPQAPAIAKPGTEKPATDQPTTEKPATDKPTTEKPTTDKP